MSWHKNGTFIALALLHYLLSAIAAAASDRKWWCFTPELHLMLHWFSMFSSHHHHRSIWCCLWIFPMERGGLLRFLLDLFDCFTSSLLLKHTGTIGICVSPVPRLIFSQIMPANNLCFSWKQQLWWSDLTVYGTNGLFVPKINVSFEKNSVSAIFFCLSDV